MEAMSSLLGVAKYPKRHPVIATDLLRPLIVTVRWYMSSEILAAAIKSILYTSFSYISSDATIMSVPFKTSAKDSNSARE